jgi:hypothetical protein
MSPLTYLTPLTFSLGLHTSIRQIRLYRSIDTSRLWHGFGGTFKKTVMKERSEEPQQQPKDSNLDIPAEANRGKHINFMEAEEESSRKTGDNVDNFAAERQKQWKEGLEEGKEAFRKNKP